MQKVKEKNPENSLLCQGIQATFLAYFSANLFGFDTFSSYLVLFLLVSYSLRLITEKEVREIETVKETEMTNKILKWIIILLLLVPLTWFIWILNIKPLKINAEINSASKLGNCQKILAKMEKTMESHSFLDHYLGIKYGNIVNTCLKKMSPSDGAKMVRKAIAVLRKKY